MFRNRVNSWASHFGAAGGYEFEVFLAEYSMLLTIWAILISLTNTPVEVQVKDEYLPCQGLAGCSLTQMRDLIRKIATLLLMNFLVTRKAVRL